MTAGEVTELLHRWRGGSKVAFDALITVMYEELKRLAVAHRRHESPAHTLDSTEIVHLAYERLLGSEVAWRDRVHFLSVASRVMRRLLIDHARAKRRVKRGGGFVQVTLDAEQIAAPERMIALEAALESLGRHDERKQRLLEMHYFGGLQYAELAEALGISEATAHRELRFARSWLGRELAR